MTPQAAPDAQLGRREWLKRVVLFQTLDDDQIDALMRITTERAVHAGEIVFRQGDVGVSLCIIASGAVRIFKAEGEHEFELGTAGEGDYFGEMALLDGAPRSASVSALEDTRLLLIGRDDYLRLLGHSQALLADILGRLSRNLRESNAHRFGLVVETEQIRTQSEIDRLRALSQMVAGVAHEINTPIGIIQNAASLVTDALGGSSIAALAKDEEAAETLNDLATACLLIQKNVAVAARLVGSFKSLSVRQIADVREQVDLLNVVTEAVGMYRFKSRAAKIDIDLRCDLAPSDRIWDGYPGHLTQVLLNLITNIDRYAYDDGGRVEVVISNADVRRGCPGFEIVVRDFGKGIPKADLGRIFDPFFTTGRHKDGTGLGLAIVHNLITSSLGGTVRVESSLGAGTSFFLRTPKVVPEGAKI